MKTKSIELNPDGTFPYPKVRKDYMATSTFSMKVDPRFFDGFIPDPPKKKEWKKEVKEFLTYLACMWCIANGIGAGLWVIIKLVIWVVTIL